MVFHAPFVPTASQFKCVCTTTAALRPEPVSLRMLAPPGEVGTVLVMDASKKRIIAYLIIAAVLAAGMGIYLLVA